MKATPACVTVALASEARLLTQPLVARPGELRHLYDTLSVLADRGHVAAFRIGSLQPPVTPDRLLRTLGHMLGRGPVEAACRTRPSCYRAPAHILPVRPFRTD